MWNPTSTGQNCLVNTTATLTLGFGPGQTAPPQLLVQNLSAGGTVTLPKIDQVGPTAPGTPGTTPGIGDGYWLTIKNIAQQVTTITPASGDTCDISAISNNGDVIMLVSDAVNSQWRQISGTLEGARTATVSTTASTTLAASTRYLIVTTAAHAITIPAGANIDVPFTILNESSGSITITPASGNINTTAAFTLTTLKSATFYGDGTNFHAINTA
jgi:hypothetical protein